MLSEGGPGRGRPGDSRSDTCLCQGIAATPVGVPVSMCDGMRHCYLTLLDYIDSIAGLIHYQKEQV